MERPVIKMVSIIKNRFVVLGVIAVLASVISAAIAHEGASGIVKMRMDKFKQSQQQLKSLIAHTKAQKYDEVARLAGYLAEWGAQIPAHFPKGSTQKPTEARPEIWIDFENFTAKAEAFRMAANRIEEAARLNDKGAVSQAIQDTAASCKSCHAMFRAK